MGVVRVAGFHKQASAESVASWLEESKSRLEHPFSACKKWLSDHPDAKADIDDDDAFCGKVKDILRDEGKFKDKKKAAL